LALNPPKPKQKHDNLGFAVLSCLGKVVGGRPLADVAGLVAAAEARALPKAAEKG